MKRNFRLFSKKGAVLALVPVVTSFYLTAPLAFADVRDVIHTTVRATAYATATARVIIGGGGSNNNGGNPPPAPNPSPEPTPNPEPTPTPEPSTGESMFSNSSLEEGASGNPTAWNKGQWGINTANFVYPVNGINSNGKAAEVRITSYSNGDAKWFPNDVSIISGGSYSFSNNYRSNIESYLTLRYQLTDGSYQYNGIAVLPSSSGEWKTFSGQFTAPSNAAKVTVFHLIQSVGFLAIDNVALTQGSVQPAPTPPPSNSGEAMVSLVFDDGWSSIYENALPIVEAAGYKSTHYIITETLDGDFDGYMSIADVLDLQSRGHEIGAHTRTHSDLTQLSQQGVRNEVTGSRQDLLNIGVNHVDTFAYPYGSYNEMVKNIVKESGFSSARSIIEGFNTKGDDPYLLKWQGPERTTSVAQMKTWIDQAIAGKSWLVLSFHEINNSGNQYSNRPQDLQEVVNYLKQKNMKVVTVSEGVQLIAQ